MRGENAVSSLRVAQPAKSVKAMKTASRGIAPRGAFRAVAATGCRGSAIAPERQAYRFGIRQQFGSRNLQSALRVLLKRKNGLGMLAYTRRQDDGGGNTSNCTTGRRRKGWLPFSQIQVPSKFAAGEEPNEYTNLPTRRGLEVYLCLSKFSPEVGATLVNFNDS